MTFDRDRHTEFEELISASVQGDLSAEERRRLDTHLDGCPTCRATLAAFSDQRRIMAGLRHVPVPRDLGARVRAGVERRASARPWWKRPPAIFAGVGGGLAVVAGALLALVLLDGNPDDRNVGQLSPSPMASSADATPIPTLPPLETPAPTAPAASVAPSPSLEPTPTATPVEASPEPDGYLAVTGPSDNQLLTVRDADTGETLAEAPAAVPVAAELSPDGQWVAYIVDLGLSGRTEVRATRIAEGIPSEDPEALPPGDSPIPVGDTVVLAESAAGNPFAEQLFWSSDGRYLAFTVVDRDGGGTDAWIYESSRGTAVPITDVGNAYAGSWVPGGAGTSLLWISTAGETPASHLWAIHDDAIDIESIAPGDPADGPYPSAVNVFQPILSPNGALVIYWTGRMERSGDDYAFAEGGAPWLAENRQAGERGYEFENNRPLFTDVTIDRDAFTSAAIRWAPDSDAFAVWEAAWTGVSQASVTYPDERRVYLGRATDPRHITWRQALDAGDVPPDSSVVDVKVAGTGRHLAITARRPTPGDLSVPEAILLLVTRNLGTVADEVEVLQAQDGGWFGPALYSPAGASGPAATDARSPSAPLGFPLFPGAESIGAAAWVSEADPSEITTFYEAALREAGFSSIGLGAGTGVSGVSFTDSAGTRWVVSVIEDGSPTEFRLIREP